MGDDSAEFPGGRTWPGRDPPTRFRSVAGREGRQAADATFPKRPLVEALSQGLEDRVLRGHASPLRTGGRVEGVAVHLSATEEEVVLSTEVTVVAAGCGSKRILQGLVGETPQTDQIKHRRVHMICVRGPRG